MKVPDLTWTYDQLVEAAQKLNKPPEVYGFSHPWRDISYYPIMGRMYGGDFYTEDGKSTVIDKPESQQGWAWHYDMMNRHKVTLNPIQTAPTPNEVFVSGKLAINRQNVGTKAAFAGITAFKWGMTLAPKGPTGNRGTLAETDVEAMTTASKNPDKAWALLKTADQQGGRHRPGPADAATARRPRRPAGCLREPRAPRPALSGRRPAEQPAGDEGGRALARPGQLPRAGGSAPGRRAGRPAAARQGQAGQGLLRQPQARGPADPRQAAAVTSAQDAGCWG